MVLHAHIEVREHALYGFTCRGLFTRELIRAGEVVWEFKAADEVLRTYRKADVDAEADEAKRATLVMFSYMLDDDVYGSTPQPDEDDSYFFNHSCEPNTWYDGDERIVALRDILPGEHVTYDYAFTETEGSLHAGMSCKCASAHCRGVLTFTEWRTREWQKRYDGRYTSYVARKIQETGWYDKRVVIRHKDVGLSSNHDGAVVMGGEVTSAKGLFSTERIRRDEVVLVFAGKVVGMDYLLACDQRAKELSLQITDKMWQVPGSHGPETSDFINHSCNPNCGMEDSVTVVAMRDIAEGEELTLDYGSINSGLNQEESDNFSCSCGAANCRRLVTSSDWRLPELQQRVWPYFPPFMKRLVVKQLKEAAMVENSQHVTKDNHHLLDAYPARGILASGVDV